MTWPGWGDIMPSVTMLATIAALLWAVVRMLVRSAPRRRRGARWTDSTSGSRGMTSATSRTG